MGEAARRCLASLLVLAAGACGPANPPPSAPTAAPSSASPAERADTQFAGPTLTFRMEPASGTGAVSATAAAQARDNVERRVRALSEPCRVELGDDGRLRVTLGRADAPSERLAAVITRPGALEMRLCATREAEIAALDNGTAPPGLRIVPAPDRNLAAEQQRMVVEVPEELPAGSARAPQVWGSVFTEADFSETSALTADGRSMVRFWIRDSRAAEFRAQTAAAAGRELAFILDGVVLVAPRIKDPLPGRGVIEGPGDDGFSAEEAEDLAAVLGAGRLPCRLVPDTR